MTSQTASSDSIDYKVRPVGLRTSDASGLVTTAFRRPTLSWRLAATREDVSQRAQPKGYSGRADEALEFFGRLYRIERQIRDANLDTRYRTRQAQSLPVLQEFRACLDAALPKVNPEGALGAALDYLDKYWPKLIRYCEAGFLPIDNNRLENGIRPFVIGRLNWKFSDTPAGAHASAALYSLIETAKASGLEPFTYLRHLYTHMPAAVTVEQIEALLPWNVDRSQVVQLPRRPKAHSPIELAAEV